MKRRKFIASAMGVGLVTAASSQEAVTSSITTQGLTFTTSTPLSPEERKRQYAICKERGHVQDLEAGGIVLTSYPAIYPKPVCKFCGTRFWTEEVSHEEGAPQ